MAAVIARSFGVTYHPAHVWRILRGEGWSCQKPERRARESVAFSKRGSIVAAKEAPAPAPAGAHK